MKLSELESQVPFDQFSRQYQANAIINGLRPKGQKLTILDVGGYKGRTADFLPEDTVTILDLYDVKDKNYVQGSALEMPFEDKSFDYVLSFDVLEHIPAGQRQRFFDECNRVAKFGVVICAPHKTPANERAEAGLNDLYKHLHDKPHEWLREHIEYGIPDFAKLEAYVNKKGLHTARFYSNKVQLWTAMQTAIFINSRYPLAAEELTKVNQFYNQNFRYDGGGSPEASYRLILCCLRNKSDATAIAKQLSRHNEPIDPELEVKLYERIANLNALLTQKTDSLAQDYKKLYEHELKRATILQANNEGLLSDVAKLEEQINKSYVRRLKNKVKPVAHKEK